MDQNTHFNPNDYSSVPLYNIQAASSASGVLAITLRSWERRYGVPEPNRDTKGYRLYSQRDIAIARWLKDRVQQGIGISRAVNMLRVLEAGELPLQDAAPLHFETLRDHLLDAVIALDEAAINRVVSQALMIGSVEDVAISLIQPALYEIGERWEAGTVSVTSEHVGSNLLRSYLAQLIRLTPPPLRDAEVVVGCAPGELHDIGALMLSLFLRRRGFRVIYAGANVEEESFVADTMGRRPAAICLSAARVPSAESLCRVFSRLSAEWAPLLGFGGRAYLEQPDLIAKTPGIYLGDDARLATRRLEAALLDRLGN